MLFKIRFQTTELEPNAPRFTHFECGIGGCVFLLWCWALSQQACCRPPPSCICTSCNSHIHSTPQFRWANGTCDRQCAVRIWPCSVCNRPQPPCNRPQFAQRRRRTAWAQQKACADFQRFLAHFRHFAAQTQQLRAPRSASIARPARSMHTAHTHIRYEHMHAHQGTCEQQAQQHAACNQVKSNA